MGITDHLVPHRSAQQLVNRHIDGFALYVPKSDVDGTDRTAIYLVGGEESATEHVLPQPFGAPRVLTYHDFGQVFYGLGDGAAPIANPDLAQAVDTLVSLYLH